MRPWKEKTQPKPNRSNGIVKTTLEIGDKEDWKTIEKNRSSKAKYIDKLSARFEKKNLNKILKYQEWKGRYVRRYRNERIVRDSIHNCMPTDWVTRQNRDIPRKTQITKHEWKRNRKCEQSDNTSANWKPESEMAVLVISSKQLKKISCQAFPNSSKKQKSLFSFILWG